MSPIINRGDLVFVSNRSAVGFRTGDIVAFNLDGAARQDRPTVHRIIAVVDRGAAYLTKGDNSATDDSVAYAAAGVSALTRDHIAGRVIWTIPRAAAIFPFL